MHSDTSQRRRPLPPLPPLPRQRPQPPFATTLNNDPNKPHHTNDVYRRLGPRYLLSSFFFSTN
jgi:hypothetical protein